MNLKNLLLIGLGLVVMVACSEMDQTQIKLSGHIVQENSDLGQLVVKYFKYVGDEPQLIDSVKVSNNGAYEVLIDDEGIYKIGVYKAGLPYENSILVVAKKGDNTILNVELENYAIIAKQFKGENAFNLTYADNLFSTLIDQDIADLYKYIGLTREQRIVEMPDLRDRYKASQKASFNNLKHEKSAFIKEAESFLNLNYTYLIGTLDYYDDISSKSDFVVPTKEIFSSIAPTSFYWSFNDQLPLMVISDYKFPFTIYGYSNELKENFIILKDLILNHPDKNVSGYTSVFSLSSLTLSSDQKYVDEITNYFLQRDGYNTEVQNIFNSMFSPTRAIKVGNQLPDFSITSLADSTTIYTNYTFNKSIYLIDIWATWCKPCMKEIPFHHQTFEKYSNSNFDILSISFDKSQDLVDKFRKNKWPMPWKHAILPEGKDSDLAKKLEANFLPQMILVDGRTNTIIAELMFMKEGNLEKILVDYMEQYN